MKRIIISAVSLLVFLPFSCKKEKEENKLSHSYAGILTYEYRRDFPGFSKVLKMDIAVAKNGTVTFGTGSSGTFSGEDIYYDGGNPAMKLKVEGTIAFISAKGEYQKINNNDCLLIWTNTKIDGTQYLWVWDNDLNDWVVPPAAHEVPFEFNDEYSDGQMQFSIDEATISGQSIKATLPDIQGNLTYGYTLNLVMGLDK